jgi:DNA-binding transcriptional MerR regulator
MEIENNWLQIGEVARASDTSVDTVRYYEKIRLLEKPGRSSGGYRLYSKAAIDKLRFIKKAQSLGLVLSEIKSIMQCSEEGLKPCCDLVRKLFSKKITEFESKIRELERMKRDLEALLAGWINPREVKKSSYVVCPQIEKEPKKRRK